MTKVRKNGSFTGNVRKFDINMVATKSGKTKEMTNVRKNGGFTGIVRKFSTNALLIIKFIITKPSTYY